MDESRAWAGTALRGCPGVPSGIRGITKRKELVGDFKNMGREWRPCGQRARVRVHDFLTPERAEAIPYGVYDLTRNAGWVMWGSTMTPRRFAVRTIGRWWQKMGPPRYPRVRRLLTTADAE